MSRLFEQGDSSFLSHRRDTGGQVETSVNNDCQKSPSRSVFGVFMGFWGLSTRYSVAEYLRSVKEYLVSVANNLDSIAEHLLSVAENLEPVANNLLSAAQYLVSVPNNLDCRTDNLVSVAPNLDRAADNPGGAADNLDCVRENLDGSARRPRPASPEKWLRPTLEEVCRGQRGSGKNTGRSSTRP